MSIRQSTPLSGVSLLTGVQSDLFAAQGQRVTITNLVGANTLQVSIDNGSYIEIAPGFPINAGLETFNTVRFKNQNAVTITFDAEIGWAERPDSRTYIPTGNGLPVTISAASTLTTQDDITLQPSGVTQIAANSARLELHLSHMTAAGTVALRMSSTVTPNAFHGDPLRPSGSAVIPTRGSLLVFNPDTLTISLAIAELS